MPCSQFRTLPGYDKLSARPLTRSMEDYLEMICRLCLQDSFARIHDLAEHLHVKPSSASKMAALLKEQGPGAICSIVMMSFSIFYALSTKRRTNWSKRRRSNIF